MRQILVPLVAGACVVIADNDERRDPFALLDRIRAARVSIVDMVPSALRQVVAALQTLPDPERETLLDNALRLLLTASEPLPHALVRDWRAISGDAVRWVNMYGQTETAGIVSLQPVGPAASGTDAQIVVPIGRPRANIRMIALDAQRRPVPMGAPGQLHIGGSCLALRYLGDPALTAARFFDFEDGRGTQRLYAAGDIVRMNEDGVFEYLGREDQQVKIRGFRVEPAEIERVLLDHPEVREVAIAAIDVDGDKRLVAYLTVHGDEPSAQALRAHLRRRLPENMIPAFFMTLEKLPTTPNGKLDRKALPPPQIGETDAAFVAPRPGDEESLAALWRELLKIERVSANDNFFLLGGHSMLAAQLRARIHQTLGVSLPLEAVFEDQTLTALAARLESARAGSQLVQPEFVKAPTGTIAPASMAQEIAWLAEQTAPGSPGQWIDVAVRIVGPLDEARQVESIEKAIQRHDILRTIVEQKDGFLVQRVVDAVPQTIRLGASDAEGPASSDLAPADGEPAIRISLRQIGEQERLLRLRCHRTLGDGATVRLLLGEIGALYANSLEGMELFPLLDQSLSYSDYAAWEHQWLAADVRQKQLDQFRRQFAAGLPPSIQTDRPRTPGGLVPDGDVVRFELPTHAVEAANAYASGERATLTMALTAAFAVALREHTAQESVAIAMPVSHRHNAATHRMLGPFMNTLPLRINGADASFVGMLRQTRDVTLAALANQNAPWHEIVAALRKDHGAEADLLGDVALVVEDAPPQNVQFAGLSLSRERPASYAVRRPLTLSIGLDDGAISGSLIYATSLFERQTIEKLSDRFVAVFGSA